MRLSVIAVLELFVILAIVNYGQLVVGDHIVFLLSCATYSHRIASWPLAEKLVAKGHQVTYISGWGEGGHLSNPKVTELVPSRLRILLNKIIEENFDVNHRAYGLVPPLIMVIDYYCYLCCGELLRSPEIKKWLDTKPKVDLVIGDSMTDCSYGFSQKLGAKNALFMPIPMVTKHFESFGFSAETSSIPDYDLSRQPPLTFLNRVMGALIPLFYRFTDATSYIWYRSLFKETLEIDVPDVYDVKNMTSLVLINGDHIMDYPRAYPPFVVKVPGIHLKKKGEHKPVPKEMEQFINSKNQDGSKNDGFFYLSFGTVAKAPNLPINLREVFFKSIEAFPKYRFVWKWDGENPKEYPKNLYLQKWVDQQDVLAHPNIKGFLTQAGRPSVQESVASNVPMITFPVLGDQDFNAHRSAGLGLSIELDFVGLTEEKLQNAIKKIVSDKSYKERVTQISKLAKDVPMDPVDVGIWWLEYVLRHTPEELSLLRPISTSLWWFQKRDLDVWAFITVCFFVDIYIAFWIMRAMYRRCFGKSKSTNQKAKMS